MNRFQIETYRAILIHGLNPYIKEIENRMSNISVNTTSEIEMINKIGIFKENLEKVKLCINSCSKEDDFDVEINKAIDIISKWNSLK